MKVAIYLRVASADQLDVLEVTAVQRRALEQYACSHNMEIHSVYSDIGLKGHDLERPDLSRLLADAQKGLFDAILVENCSRLYRGKGENISVPVISLNPYERGGKSFDNGRQR